MAPRDETSPEALAARLASDPDDLDAARALVHAWARRGRIEAAWEGLGRLARAGGIGRPEPALCRAAFEAGYGLGDPRLEGLPTGEWLAVDPRLCWLVDGGPGRPLAIRAVGSGRLLLELPLADTLARVAAGPDGSRGLAVGIGPDQTLTAVPFEWPGPRAQAPRPLPGLTPDQVLDLDPVAMTLLVRRARGGVDRVSLPGERRAWSRFDLEDGAEPSLAKVAPDGRAALVAATPGDRTRAGTRLWWLDLEAGRAHPVHDSRQTVMTLAWAPDGAWAAMGLGSGALQLFAVRGTTLALWSESNRVLEPFGGTRLHFAPQGGWLAGESGTRTRIYPIPLDPGTTLESGVVLSGIPVAVARTPLRGFVLRGEGSAAVVAPAGSPAAPIGCLAVRSFQVDPEAGFALLLDGRTSRAYDLGTGAPGRRLPGAAAACLAPDGKVAALADRDGLVRLVGPTRGDERGQLRFPVRTPVPGGEGPLSLAFSGDGSRLFLAGARHGLQVASTSPGSTGVGVALPARFVPIRLVRIPWDGRIACLGWQDSPRLLYRYPLAAVLLEPAPDGFRATPLPLPGTLGVRPHDPVALLGGALDRAGLVVSDGLRVDVVPPGAPPGTRVPEGLPTGAEDAHGVALRADARYLAVRGTFPDGVRIRILDLVRRAPVAERPVLGPELTRDLAFAPDGRGVLVAAGAHLRRLAFDELDLPWQGG